MPGLVRAATIHEDTPMHQDALPSRRMALALLAAVCLAPGLGCGGDDTVRGAGSIEVPPENLKFEPKPKGKKAKSKD